MSLKNIVDCHVHSNFSPDSAVSPKEIVIGAMKRGLAGVTISDHVDLDYPTENHLFDFAARAKVLNELGQTHPIKVLHGLELGFQPTKLAESSKIVRGNYFDLVINSTHVVDSTALCHESINDAWTKDQVYRRYLSAVYASVMEVDDFDIVGHIGFIARYVPYEDPSLRYKDYADLFDKILNAIIRKGKGIEVNTAGYAYKINAPHPDFDVLARYKELGGTILTLSSDAHSVKQIGNNFEKVLSALPKIGFTHVTYFEKRKPIFVPIL